MLKVGDRVLVSDTWGVWEAKLLELRNNFSSTSIPVWIVEGERPLAPPGFLHLYMKPYQFGQFAVAEYHMHLIVENNNIMKGLCSK